MLLRRLSVLFVVLFAIAAQAQDAFPVKRDGVWAQDYADRPADPAVRFGTLANGMRYAIQHNATPAGRTSLRMRIGSGSLDERDDQQGLAHFLEHMAFRGSTHVPSGEVVKILQRLGLAFGADTNASTGFDETIYKFDLPHSDAETVGTGLMLLREIAGELTLAQSEMDPERGVVLSEERVRDGPGYRQMVAGIGFQLEGQLAARRMPIGKVEILRDAPVSLIRDFYEAFYRPDNATLVAIGDFDPAAMEAEIKSRFSDWTPKRAGAMPQRNMGQVLARGPAARVFTAPETAADMSVTWIAPYDPAADVAARERRDLLENLAVGVLTRRLESLAQGTDAPFLSASAERGDMLKSAKLMELSVSPKPGAWDRGLTAAVIEARRLAQYGVLPEELARAEQEFLTTLRSAAEGAATRPSNRIADGIVRAANDNEVYTSPAQDLAEVTAILGGLKIQEVDAAAKRLFVGAGPLVFLAGSAPIAGGEAAVTAVLARAAAAEVTPPAGKAEASWPYAPAVTPGAIATQARIEDLDVTDVTFANGVRLLVKRTPFARDEVRVRVRLGYGRLGIPPDRAAMTWTMAGIVPLLRLGGTKELSWEDIQRLTASNKLGVAQGLEDDSFVLEGTTRPADLDRQLELLQAYATAPGLRPAPFERVKASLMNQLPQVGATASGVFGRIEGPLLHGGDKRWQRIPDADEVETLTPADFAGFVTSALAEGPLALVVVGDIDPAQAIAAVAHSFGALPRRGGRAVPAAGPVAFPKPSATPTIVPHGGRADQAVAMAAWPTMDFFADPQGQRALGMMAAVLQSRLTDRLRVAEGVTYSPQVAMDYSQVFPGMGSIEALVETPADKVDLFYDEVAAQVESLRAAPPSADELERAKRPRVDQRMKVLQENGYWTLALSDGLRDPRNFETIRNLVPANEKVSAQDVQDVARRFLIPGGAFRLVVRSGGK